MEYKEIRSRLAEMADADYKKFHSNLCPGKENILGIRMPKLRAFAKELMQDKALRQNPGPLLDEIAFASAEEIMLYGYILSLARLTPDGYLPYLETYIRHIDSWATCDSPVASMKFMAKDRPFFWAYLLPLLSSPEEYTVRFAVVSMLDHFMVEPYIPQILSCMESVRHEGYYVKMAVAWTISICFIHSPEVTLEFLQHADLDDFTYNKSLQKTCESYRIDPETKAMLRKMKR